MIMGEKEWHSKSLDSATRSYPPTPKGEKGKDIIYIYIYMHIVLLF